MGWSPLHRRRCVPGRVTLEELRERMPQLRRQEADVRAQLADLEARAVDRETYLKLAEGLQDFLVRLRESVEDARQRTVRLLVKEILVGPERVVVRHSIPGAPSGADWRLSFAWEGSSRFPAPEIFNTDQSAQFTAEAFTRVLRERGIRISMDGKGRCLDNVFVERLWRSLKYEEVYLHAYTKMFEARTGITRYMRFYDESRPHQALGYQTPAAFYDAELAIASAA
jgi:putative transposase